MNTWIEFNFYYDCNFWLFYSIAVIIFRQLDFNSIFKKIFLLFCSVLMLLALPKFNIFTFSFLFFISFFVYIVGYLLKNENIQIKKLRPFFSIFTVSLLTLILAFYKYSFIQKISFGLFPRVDFSPSSIIFIIGISYSTFKMIHFIVESYKREINDLNFLNFLNYIFFFPAFISGPINRYNLFTEQINLPSSKHKESIRYGVERIVHGLFKKFVLCTIVFPYALVNLKKNLVELNSLEIMLGVYAYAFYFYFDFAGYSDIAIGSARIIGIELPENFNNPFVKKNIQQLWASWHISFTSWLTDYIYWPLSKKLRKYNYFKKRPVSLSNASIIITFIVCGMWHGDTVIFILWGLYHGIGLSLLNIYQKYKRKTKNKTLRTYYRSEFSKILGIIGTFNFFALGLLFFAFDTNKILQYILKIYRDLGGL